MRSFRKKQKEHGDTMSLALKPVKSRKSDQTEEQHMIRRAARLPIALVLLSLYAAGAEGQEENRPDKVTALKEIVLNGVITRKEKGRGPDKAVRYALISATGSQALLNQSAASRGAAPGEGAATTATLNLEAFVGKSVKLTGMGAVSEKYGRELITIREIKAIEEAAAADWIESRLFRGKSGQTLPYRLWKPHGYDSNKKYPLVLNLHGAGGKGDDNLGRGNWALKVLTKEQTRAEHPAFLVAPQCPESGSWINTSGRGGSYSINEVEVSVPLQLTLEMVGAVCQEFPIDSDRIYVTGESMGGYGTWDIILRTPDLFAAAVPICGAGDPSKAERLRRMAIWIFHGAKDNLVPVEGSRQMYEALKAVGADVRYTEFKDAGHGAWVPAWQEPGLVPWLFAQRRWLGGPER